MQPSVHPPTTPLHRGSEPSRAFRVLAVALAVLLTVPLLSWNATSAMAIMSTSYDLTWVDAAHDEVGPEIGTRGTGRNLRRHISAGDYTVDIAQETFEVDPPGAASLAQCEDLSGTTISNGDEVTETCRVTFDHDQAPDGVVEITWTLTDSADDVLESQTATAIIFDADIDVAGPGGEEAPVLVTPGTQDLEITITNTGGGDLDVDRIQLAHNITDEEVDGTCDPVTDLEPGQQETTTCTFADIDQYTPTRVTIRLSPSEELPGLIAFSQAFSNAIDLQLNPSVEMTATADPSTIDAGDSSDVTVVAENTGDVIFDAFEFEVMVDGVGICSYDATDAFAPDDDLSFPCTVSPDLGEDVSVGDIELLYTIWNGSTNPYGLDPILVDLTAEGAGMSVEARYGAHNESLDDLFVERRLLPINPLPMVASGPAVLEVTVTNDGTVDLADVEVTTDLAGCSATFDLAGGTEEVFECAGEPVGPDDVQPTTTVTAMADVPGGPSLTATDVASFDVIGIGLDVNVDPDWDGTGVEIPFHLTLTNTGGLDLEGNTYETFLGELHHTRFGDCTQLGLATLPVGGTAIYDECTLLAGDLVDGLSIVAYGSDGPAIGEWLTSHDVVEVQLDPDGVVIGNAELNGEAFGNVEVELRLLELLELPTSDVPTPPDLGPAGAASAASSTSGAPECETVGALTAADEGGIVAATTSGPDGGFCFDQVPPGEYQIVVTSDTDADLDGLVVGGQDGFTTNSPATSEPFFIGFASAALGNPVVASLEFTSDEEQIQQIERVADDAEPDEEQLPETGVSTWALALSALLALLLGSALLGASQTARTPIRQRVGMRATRH